MAAPLWAGAWALANQANKDEKGYVFSASGGYFYTLPANAFHAPSTMTSATYWNVGLGSPNIAALISDGLPPEIEKFTPDSGPASGGTVVTITGTGFIGVEKVTFGGVAGKHLKIESQSKLTVETPAHVGGNDMLVELVTPGGVAKLGSFTFVPSISGFNPKVGPTTGGESVEVSGSGLSTGMTLQFGTDVVKVTSCSGTTLCGVISPAHVAGSVPLMTTVGGVASAPSKDDFSFKVFPTITGISPNTIPLNTASTPVNVVLTLTGTGFSTTSGKTVFSYSGLNLSDVVCSSKTSCTAVFISPALGSAKVETVTTGVTVTVGGLTSLDSVDLTYSVASPVQPCKGTTCS